MKKNILIKSAVLLEMFLFMFFFFGCGDKTETSVETETPHTNVRFVKVSPVKAIPPRGTVEYVGVLQAHRKVNVASEIGGTKEN